MIIQIIKIMMTLFLLAPVLAQVDYNSQIQPIFDARCISCHGSMGGLNLTSYANLIDGGLSGDEVIPYDHISSELWVRVNSGQMPPGNNDLTDIQVNLIAQWIDEGALLNGDVNADGVVNILDVVLLVNMVLNNEYNPSDDLNSDSVINILDVVLLVGLILDA